VQLLSDLRMLKNICTETQQNSVTETRWWTLSCSTVSLCARIIHRRLLCISSVI